MKRKTPDTTSTIRPAKVAKWSAQHVANYVLACDPSAGDIASKIVREHIDGRAALRIDESDLKSICPSTGKRKNLQLTLQNLSHPLFPAFVAMDTNGDNTISSGELAHVLTRVKGRVVTEEEASGLIAMGDEDSSGDIDFEEFKGIAKKSAKDADWSKAAQAVGAPASLFGAGTAMMKGLERSMSGTHAALQAGAAFQTGYAALSGYQKPNFIMRLILFFVGAILGQIVNALTGGIAGILSLFVTIPVGQTLDMWCVSLQYKNLDGSDLGFMKMLAKLLFGGTIIACIAGLMMATEFAAVVAPACQYGMNDRCGNAIGIWMVGLFGWVIIMMILDNLTALFNHHGQTLQEQIFGIVLVYKQPAVAQTIIVVQNKYD